ECYRRSTDRVVQRLKDERDNITGVVITSAKKTFFAGGDLRELIRTRPADAEQASETVAQVKAQLRRLETLGKPVVAALNGTALGGGLEIALACHHMIALNAPGFHFEFPDLTIGVLPRGGCVVRTVRPLGITDAQLNLLLQGQQLRPEKANEIGIIDVHVDTPDDLLSRAKEWIKQNP